MTISRNLSFLAEGASATGVLTTTNGGTNLTSFTANGVVYASSTSALATGSALTYDGTNFATTGSATATSFIPSSATVPTNGMYLPAANSVGIATASTNRMTIDASGRVGFGNTPSAWGSIFKPIQLGNAGAFIAGRTDSVIQVQVGSNAYFDGTNWVYQTNGTAYRYYQASPTGHVWSYATAGTAGNAITFVDGMTLFASGGLSLGNTTDPGAGNLSVTGTGKFGTTVGVGAATPSTSGAGITFPATQSSSTNANTLDDYEEGTYTPADNSGASLVFTGVSGSYTKVGRLVYFVFQLTYPTTVSVSVAVITLPFSIFVNGSASIGYTDYIAANQLYAGVSTGRTGVRFLNVGTELTNANLSGKTFIVSGTYQTDT